MEHSVCFIGHRTINDTPQLCERLHEVLSDLIQNGAVHFIFGDHSAFNDLCYELVTEMKENHPTIKRIKFRKEYENADEYTMRFLTDGFEESICPKGADNAGRASYIKRNQAMIDESEICVFYYDEHYIPFRRKHSKSHLSDYQPKSGTALAYRYAESKKKTIINCFFQNNNEIHQ